MVSEPAQVTGLVLWPSPGPPRWSSAPNPWAVVDDVEGIRWCAVQGTRAHAWFSHVDLFLTLAAPPRV